jgi:glycine/D-amino acid oxidase-like deaminating enzyme
MHAESKLQDRYATMPNIAHDRTYWNATAAATDFPPTAGDLRVDVAVVGEGIVRITAARLLKDRGMTGAVVEARRVGREVHRKSTAKMTSQHGIIYQTLEQKFGLDQARLYAEAQETGIRRISKIATQYGIDADIEPKIDIFDATRVKPIAGAKEFVKENSPSPRICSAVTCRGSQTLSTSSPGAMRRS